MKLSLKHIYICSLIGLGASTLASCNDFLDREPITNVTPEAYFTTVDQVGAYVINYYSYLQNSRQQSLYHDKNWRSGMTLNDNNTDNLFSQTGDLDYLQEKNKYLRARTFKLTLPVPVYGTGFLSKFYQKKKREAYKVTSLF